MTRDFFVSVEKPKPCLPGRSGSLDNLIAVPYLSGHWPKDGQWQGSKDGAFLPFRTFHTDKQTQVYTALSDHTIL